MKDTEHYGKSVSGLTGSVRTFEYVPNSTSIHLVTLERESGGSVSLEAYHDIIRKTC